MSRPVDHHFVPQFYLRRWASGAPATLVAYRRLPNGSLERKRRAPSGVGYEKHLYDVTDRLSRVDGVEMAFARIESDASQIVEALLTEGLDALRDDAASRCLAQFLLSLLLKQPATMAKLVSEAAEMVDERTRGNERMRAIVYGSDLGGGASFARNLAVYSLPGLALRSPFLERFTGKWSVVMAPADPAAHFVTSDAPLVEWPRNRDGVKFTIALDPTLMLVILEPDSSALDDAHGEARLIVDHTVAIIRKATTAFAPAELPAGHPWLRLVEAHLQEVWLHRAPPPTPALYRRGRGGDDGGRG